MYTEKSYHISRNSNKNCLQGDPKKASYFVFHPIVVLYNFFKNFSGGVDSRPGRFFWHQYGSNWTIYYAAVDKNHWGILYHKISFSDRAEMRRDFGRNDVPDRRTIQCLVPKFWETGCVTDAPQKPRWPTLFKSFKSNKPGLFSILWLISSQNVSRSALFWSVCLCRIWIL